MVVFHHPERERGVGLNVGGGIEVASKKLLHWGAGLGGAIASAELYGGCVVPIHVDDAESLPREHWV